MRNNTRANRSSRKSGGRRVASVAQARSIAQGSLQSSFMPMRLAEMPNPQMSENTVTVNHRFQAQYEPDENITSINISTSDLMEAVPGGTSFWNRVRFEKIAIWLQPQTSTTTTGSLSSTEQGQLKVTLPGDSNRGFAPATYQDNGVLGERFSNVVFKFPLLQRQFWYNTANTDSLFSLDSNVKQPAMGVTTQKAVYIIEFTAQLVSPTITA